MQKISLVGLNRIYKKHKEDKMVECYPYIRDFFCIMGNTYKIQSGKSKETCYIEIYGIINSLYKGEENK